MRVFYYLLVVAKKKGKGETVKLIFIAILLLSVESYAQGLTKVRSAYNNQETVKIIRAFLTKKKINIFNTIDHQDGANKVGLKLRPTTLIIFGNPKVGTNFMQKDQLVGYDLPMKVLVYTDQKNETFIAYQKTSELTEKHSLKMKRRIVKKVDKLFSGIESTVRK